MSARACTAILFLLASTPLSAQSLSNAPVRATPEPFAETVHGVRIDDPYRWMERADRADDVAAFIRSSSAPTVAALKAMPGYAAGRVRKSAGWTTSARVGL